MSVFGLDHLSRVNGRMGKLFPALDREDFPKFVGF